MEILIIKFVLHLIKITNKYKIKVNITKLFHKHNFSLNNNLLFLDKY